MNLQSHRFNMYNLPTTVHEGDTSCKMSDNKDENKTSLDIHRRKHAEHQESYKHNICADTASRPNYLVLNEMKYTTGRRHKCDLCDYSSSRSKHLQAHKLLLTGEKPYKCNLCDFRLTQAGNLKVHKVIHTEEKPYKCDLCHFSFKLKGDLKIRNINGNILERNLTSVIYVT